MTTRKNLPANKLHQDRCTHWCVHCRFQAALHCTVDYNPLPCTNVQSVDNVVVAIARLVCKSDPGHWTQLPPQSHHQPGNLAAPWHFYQLLTSWIFLKIAKVAADHPANASHREEKLAAHIEANDQLMFSSIGHLFNCLDPMAFIFIKKSCAAA